MNPLTSEILAGQRAPEDTDAPSDSPGDAGGLDAVAEQTITTTDSRTDDTHAVPFRDLGVSDTICLALEGAGIYTTFPIQALTIPLALGGQDIIGQAKTGTGKTLGFGLPLLQRLATATPRRARRLQALVVVPTRELCVQVAEDLGWPGSGPAPGSLAIYGGRAYEPQIEALQGRRDIVVGTPGRLLDLAGQRHLDLSNVRELVLDEADKMLDLGFLPDVESCFALTPDDRQTMLFSATMPGRGRRAGPALHEPADPHPRRGARRGRHAAHIKQLVYRAHQLDKDEVIARDPAGRGPRQDHGVHPHQARRRPARRGAERPRLRGRRRARRPGPGPARAGAARVPRRQGGRAGGHRRRRPRHRRRRRHARDQLPSAPTTTRPTCTASAAPAAPGKTGIAVTFVDWDDMHQWKLINTALGARPAGAGGDLLVVAAPLHRAGHPARASPARCPGRAKPGRAGCGGGRGPRRDRRPDSKRLRRWRWPEPAVRGAGPRRPGATTRSPRPPATARTRLPGSAATGPGGAPGAAGTSDPTARRPSRPDRRRRPAQPETGAAPDHPAEGTSTGTGRTRTRRRRSRGGQSTAPGSTAPGSTRPMRRVITFTDRRLTSRALPSQGGSFRLVSRCTPVIRPTSMRD